MAFNNSNRSLASQRFINSINAIVIQPDWGDWDGWEWGLANLGIGIVSLGAAWWLWQKQQDPCLKALNKILAKSGDPEKALDKLVKALNFVAGQMRLIKCTSWTGLGEYMERLRGPMDELGNYSNPQLGASLVNRVGNVIDKALAAGCTMKEILDRLKSMTKGRIPAGHWKQLDKLQNLTEAAAAAGLAAWMVKTWFEFQNTCSGACSRAAAVSNYLKSIFPDIAIDILSVIAGLIVLIAALIVLVKAGTIIGGVAGAAALLVAAEGSLAAAVEEAEMVPDGMSTDEFIQSLLEQTANIGCESPTVDTSDDDTPPAGAPIFTDEEEDDTPPGGGMPPPKAPPTTNSNASRQIFNRKLS
jgi:hypothetical protein